MTRAPFQVLVFPYHLRPDGIVIYAVFRRSDTHGGYWQGIAGGGEDDELPIAAAQREAEEEAGIPRNAHFMQLDTCCSIPVEHFAARQWPADVFVIPEYAFGVEAAPDAVRLSPEHVEHRWLPYRVAADLMQYDSNRTALWELEQRVRLRQRS